MCLVFSSVLQAYACLSEHCLNDAPGESGPVKTVKGDKKAAKFSGTAHGWRNIPQCHIRPLDAAGLWEDSQYLRPDACLPPPLWPLTFQIRPDVTDFRQTWYTPNPAASQPQWTGVTFEDRGDILLFLTHLVCIGQCLAPHIGNKAEFWERAFTTW